MDNEIDLSALRAFHSVVRAGSFAAAARELNAPRSTVAKKVADLEANLGVRLIERTTRSMRITAEGEVLARRASRLLAEASDLRRVLTDAGQAPRGHLRIGMPDLFEQITMGELAASFRRKYPAITLETVITSNTGDLMQSDLDAVIAFGPLQDSTLMSRKLFTGTMSTVAAPDLPGLDNLRHPSDIVHMPLIDVPQHWVRQWVFHQGDVEETVRIEPALSFSSALAALAAAIDGAGIARIPTILANPELSAGRLVRVLPEWSGPSKSVYFIYPSALSVTMRLRYFLDELVAWMAREDERRAELKTPEIARLG
ncbi:LysR family transcriptional regulator [Pseudooceanicola pacificus]|nr:LysR family transcriptional regulator [Pseudooceanicola pacificus]